MSDHNLINPMKTYLSLILGQNWSLETHNWSDKGNTPLHFAVEVGNAELVKLLACRDKANFEGNTALYLAIEKGNQDIISSILSRPEYKEAALSAISTNRRGESALQHARTKSSLENVVETIENCLRKTAGLTFIVNPHNITCTDSSKFDIELVKGAIKAKDADLFQHYISLNGWPELLLRWQDPDTHNTILQWMLEFNFLINNDTVYESDSDTNFNINSDVVTATHYYMAMILLDFADQINNFKGFINHPNKDMETAEHIAIRTDQMFYLDLFHSRGSDIYARDKDGYNALYRVLTVKTLRDITQVDSILCLDKYYSNNPGKIAGRISNPNHRDLIGTKGNDGKCALQLALENREDAKQLVQEGNIWYPLRASD
ncbi:hypothetical protein TSTA_111020 [Talaromyces stipitatus ATCC 10500]|uniref:Ankyrin repeat-containing protein n=1 Tax=Talaromyces stipitatus (strain ATCC 10500 / CBS 375.48 / QM 6759 / NRRL 1006) TaxID=441959 RepID=B8MU69_TALSN|nr:uncharacterized protein TSTA_111020 [Talaromyces stipitatus ATCC 10500]EED11925.1 hypothetical protein TSTA_111020 [Talaromyces stipitatus ATCC 10500]